MDKKLALDQFSLSEDLVFLVEDPLDELPPYFEEWNRLGKALPQFVPSRTFRIEIEKMPLLDYQQLSSHKEHCLAFLLLSFMGSGYVWQDGEQGVPKRLPRQLAIPWAGVANYFRMKPILSNLSYALSNYRLKDSDGDFSNLSNLQALATFPDAQSSNCFTILTVQSERLGVPGIKAIVDAINAVEEENNGAVLDALQRMTRSMDSMTKCMAQLHEKLTPEGFFNNVRPYFFGWGGGGNPLPDGLIYEGVSTSPIQCHGASAGQSSTIQCFNAALGIVHEPDKEEFMHIMRQHMPGNHRQFVEAVEQRSRIKTYVTNDQALLSEYKHCVESLRNFRNYHLQIVAKYLVIPGNKLKTKPVGTSGSNVMPFLKNIRDKTTHRDTD